MNRRTYYLSIYFLLIWMVQSYTSKAQSLSKRSSRVKNAWEQLTKNPDSKQIQLNYLAEFPSDMHQFNEVFQTPDYGQLYSESHTFITYFIQLSKYYPDRVIEKAINICKDLKYEADASGDLQRSIIDLGNNNIRIFSRDLNALPDNQAKHLITFLADVENHKAYTEYQHLIDTLNSIGESGLARKFVDARQLRKKVRE